MAAKPVRGLDCRVLAGLRYYEDQEKSVLHGHELKCALTAVLGFRPSKQQIDIMTGGRGAMHRDDFVSYARAALASVHQTVQVLDTHSRGFITVDDLVKVGRALGDQQVAEGLIDAFHEADTHKTGRVSFFQFESIFQKAEAAASDGGGGMRNKTALG